MATLFLFIEGNATDIFGRVSFRTSRIENYLGDTNFSARGIGVRLSMQDIFDSGLNFNVRYRSGKLPNSSSNNPSKLYYLNLSHNNIWTNFGFTIGRLNSPIVGAYGILDGFQVQYCLKENYYFGGFWGTEPDLLTYKTKDDIKRSGIFASIDLGRKYQGSVSLIRQTYLDKLDRVFLFVDNDIELSDSWSFGQFAEIDLVEKDANDVQKQTIRFTDVFADLRFAPTQYFSATLTYTTHKEFRYLEFMSDTPDSLFENSVDQSYGLRLNVRPFRTWRFYSRLRYGLNSAVSGKERFFTLGAANYNFFSTRIYLTGRYAQNDGYYANSNSWYVSAERPFWEKFRASVAFSKTEIDYKMSGSNTATKAIDVVFTYNLSWHFYLYFKGTYVKGDNRNENMLFVELSYKIRSYKDKTRP